MTNTFNAAKVKDDIVNWIRDWFEQNGPDCNAVLGISGGKDSTIAAALCVEALGADRVVGVLMPCQVQHDIQDSVQVCEFLGIKNLTINIAVAVNSILTSVDAYYNPKRDGFEDIEISRQTRQNLPPRVRMTTLYAVSQSMNGRVVNTCNLSETMIGWETRWGDAVGDFSPLARLTATEVIAIGDALNLPYALVHKTPADGLCGSCDEDAFGFTYAELDSYLRGGTVANKKHLEKIEKMIANSKFKREPIPAFEYQP